MCGISVVVNGTEDEVLKMGHAINHRGVHDSHWSQDGVHVFFSLLPITDTSSKVQPYRCGNYTVWLNGYISNYKELAWKYNSIKMESECDTELLAKFIDYHKFSYESILELNGFFAIVVYDHDKKEVYSITDRYGIKQLYSYHKGDVSYLCSEVKGLLAIMDEPELDSIAVQDWRYSLGVLTQHTIFKGIKRIARVSMPVVNPFRGTYEEAKKILTGLLAQSISRNIVHDKSIKTGVFVSGGVDSGFLAANMYADYSFSMDYADDQYSENRNIRRNSHGKHITMICNREMWNEYGEKTMMALDDLKVGSCYTNYALTELASKFCTVLYSGAGADELFDGYNHRYNKPLPEVIRRNRNMPLQDLPDYLKDPMGYKIYDYRYLEGILVVEDRMSGAHTMETRYPFLDNDLVDFATSLRGDWKYDKMIFRDVAYESGVHHEVIMGKKRGFSNPHVNNEEWAEFALEQIKKLYNIK